MRKGKTFIFVWPDLGDPNFCCCIFFPVFYSPERPCRRRCNALNSKKILKTGRLFWWDLQQERNLLCYFFSFLFVRPLLPEKVICSSSSRLDNSTNTFRRLVNEAIFFCCFILLSSSSLLLFALFSIGIRRKRTLDFWGSSIFTLGGSMGSVLSF